MTNTPELLDGIVDELTQPIACTWTTDHGTTVRKNTPCLLDQLREAIERPDRTLTGGKAKMYPNVTNLGALDLEQDIKSTVSKYYRRYRRRGEAFESVKAQLRSWAANARSHEKSAAAEAFGLLSHYRNAILEIFNPHTIEIAASCPHCNMRYAERTEGGETTRTSVLKANSDSVICTACKKAWDSSQFKDLRKQIAARPPTRQVFAIQNFK